MLLHELVGGSRTAHARHRVHHGDPARLEQLADLAEVGAVERLADVLHHADRSHSVERARDVAIIHQLEPDTVRNARLRRALSGKLELLDGQCDAEHIHVRDAVQVQRQPAPAAADVEHLHAGLETQLGRNMRLLVELGLLDRVGGVGEVAAAVLQVFVEEEPVEVIADVVVVRDIPQRRGPPVERAQRVAELASLLEEWVGAFGILPSMAAAHDIDQVQYLALLEHEPPIHERFGSTEAGVLEDVGSDAAVDQAHGHRLEPTVFGAVTVRLAVMVNDGDLAALDVAAKRLVEQPHHPERAPTPIKRLSR